MNMIWGLENQLVEGDAMEPLSTDLILQRGRLNVGRAVPQGWRVLTGNQFHSEVVRVAYRFEIEEERDRDEKANH